MPEGVIWIVGISGVCFGVIMPLIISSASIQEKKIKLQRELAQGGGAEMRAELADTKAEMARLRDRVAVLEKLATDDDRRLASEIASLSRRAPVNPGA